MVFRRKKSQKSIFDHDVYLPPKQMEALEATWAGVYRDQILPMIDEEPFKPFYCEDNGRPNIPVSIMISLCVFKEMFDMTDAELLGSLEFDLRFQYALDLNASEAHICQKSLHNFRVLIVANEKAREIFQNITSKIGEAIGTNTSKQRLDSTHIISNMANLSRLALFTRTIEGFLAKLKKDLPERFAQLPKRYAEIYVERAGYFADVKSSKAKRRLGKCAKDLYDLIDRFRGDEEVTKMECYQLMVRLFEEQCEIEEEEGTDQVVIKDKASSTSLQNPSDPDATYGRKGKGYKGSITETCHEDNAFQLITDGDLMGAHESDQHDVLPTIARLETNGMKPEELSADAGYGSGENIVEAREHGVELTAPITGGTAPDEKRMQLSDFETSMDGKEVKQCLQGHAPLSCSYDGDKKSVETIFPSSCKTCDLLPICLVKKMKDGNYVLRYELKEMATSKRRVEQESSEFKERYKKRSGIEGTISEADRVTGIKRSWTRGEERVRASFFMKLAAVNVKRSIANRLKEIKRGVLQRREVVLERIASEISLYCCHYLQHCTSATY